MDIGKCLQNFARCRRSEHILFRGYGLNVIDSPRGLRTGDIKTQLAEYYPDVTGVSVIARNTYDGVSQGHFAYDIDFTGYRRQ